MGVWSPSPILTWVEGPSELPILVPVPQGPVLLHPASFSFCLSLLVLPVLSPVLSFLAEPGDASQLPEKLQQLRDSDWQLS